MPRGRTKSKLSLRQRRKKAFDLFLRGYSDEEVAKRLNVTRQTAYNYRKRYEEHLRDTAAQDPEFFNDVLANTKRTLMELDAIRKDAWEQLKKERIHVIDGLCQECGEKTEIEVRLPLSDQSRTQYHNTLLKAQDQRAKLFGVLGVKQEVFVTITQVRTVQDRILAFLQRHLCGEDRTKLEQFLLSDPDVQDYLAISGGASEAVGQIVEAELVEE